MNVRFGIDSYDNKERVYYDGIGGSTAELRIEGYDITSDVEGCGTNSMRVWYAFLFEDDDRDDSDGPTSTEIQAEL